MQREGQRECKEPYDQMQSFCVGVSLRYLIVVKNNTVMCINNAKTERTKF